MKHNLDTLITRLTESGLDKEAESLKKISAREDGADFRVAIVGEFKTGKSTLINRIFLSKPLLFTDIREATAVPTEISYGPEPLLKVYHYRKRKSTSEDDPTGEILDGIDEPMIIPDPDTETLKKYTAGDTPETKNELVRTMAHVRLELPEESLKGLVLIDTPGVDSGTEAVMSTVFRVLPTVDLAIFVKKPTQFSEPEIEFLTSQTFGQTSMRGLVLVNEDPRFSQLDEAQRFEIKTAMEAQLRNIGRLRLPIEWTELTMAETKSVGGTSPYLEARSQPQEKRGSLLERIRREAPTENEEKDTTVPSSGSNEKDLAQQFVRYLKANAPQGRIGRIRNQLDAELERILGICRLELSCLNKPSQDLSKQEEAFKEREPEFRAKYDEVGRLFLEDLGLLQRSHVKRLRKGLDALFDRYNEEINESESLSDSLAVAQKLQQYSKGDIEEIVYRVSQETQAELDEIQRKYDEELRSRFAPYLSSSLEEERLYAGFFAQVPKEIYYFIDILFSIKLGPLGVLGDLIMRLISSKIPLLKNIMPSQLLKNLFIDKTVKNSLRKGVEHIVGEVERQIDGAFIEASQQIETGWGSAWESQVESIRESMHRAQSADAEERRKQLDGCIEAIEEARASLA